MKIKYHRLFRFTRKGKYYWNTLKAKCDSYIQIKKIVLEDTILGKSKLSNGKKYWWGRIQPLVEIECNICGRIYILSGKHKWFYCPYCVVTPNINFYSYFSDLEICREYGKHYPYYPFKYRKDRKKIIKGPISIIKHITGREFIFKCHQCGNTFRRNASRNTIIDCPFCNKNISHGELACMNYLKKVRVNFIYGYVSHAIYKGHLHFDFWLPNKRIAIEYDGSQHFHPVQYWGGQKAFHIEKKRDAIKNRYCKSHKIKLIRIPYWDFNKIPNILNKQLA